MGCAWCCARLIKTIKANHESRERKIERCRENLAAWVEYGQVGEAEIRRIVSQDGVPYSPHEVAEKVTKKRK